MRRASRESLIANRTAKKIRKTEIQMFKNGFRIKCGMTDVGLIQFEARSFTSFRMTDGVYSGDSGLQLFGLDCSIWG